MKVLKILILVLFFLPFINQTSFCQNRIFGGDEIEIYEAPWQVSLESSSGSHFCGGSIINQE